MLGSIYERDRAIKLCNVTVVNTILLAQIADVIVIK